MDIDKLQNRVVKIFMKNAKRDKIKITDDYLVLKLTEELGEFVQAYLMHQKRCRPEKFTTQQKSKKLLSKELADVVCLIFAISRKLNINLEEALVKKYITKEWMNNN